MAERERPPAPPDGGVFVARSEIMDANDLRRAIRRMAHEVIERNQGLDDIVFVGLQTGGADLAHLLAETLEQIDATKVPVGLIDVAFHRDDLDLRPIPTEAPTHIPVDLTDRVVVLVDDVLFTGRTVRAALDAIAGFGRPRAVQLAVMVDRGHRELPIRPDFVGKNLPTRRDEIVDVSLQGVLLGSIGPQEGE